MLDTKVRYHKIFYKQNKNSKNIAYFVNFLLKIIQLIFIYYIDILLLHIYTKKDPYKGILKKTFPMTSSLKSK